MARKKEYKEEEVVEIAMNLFWKNGYEATSMKTLEKEMGINKFSIYASFGNKDGLFVESIKCYTKKVNSYISRLGANGIIGLKQYFYDFIEFTKENGTGKGCLITNTFNEFGSDADGKIKEALSNFRNDLKQAFASSLKRDKTKDLKTIEQQTNYLIISMIGLSSASRVYSNVELENYIENLFKNI